MIKVLINGTPIYRLEFHRRKYKSLKRKNLTAGQIIERIVSLDENPSKIQVVDAIRAAFERKPLYETTAIIHMINAKKDEPPVATATTRQSKLDDNRRSTGREVALGRLLREGGAFNEIERKAIRQAYDNRTKPSKKPSPPSGAGSAPIAQVRKASTHEVVSKVISFPNRTGVTMAA